MRRGRLAGADVFGPPLAPVPFLVAWVSLWLLEPSTSRKPWGGIASLTGRREPLALRHCSAHVTQVPVGDTGFPV